MKKLLIGALILAPALAMSIPAFAATVSKGGGAQDVNASLAGKTAPTLGGTLSGDKTDLAETGKGNVTISMA